MGQASNRKWRNRIMDLTQKYIKEGMSEGDAFERAIKEINDMYVNRRKRNALSN